MVRDTRAGLAFFLASVGLHLIAAMAIWNVPRLPGVDLSAVEVDLWTGAPRAPGEPPGIERRGVAPLVLGGLPQAQNLDAPHRGARGDGRSEGMVVLLMPRADGVTLSDTARSSLDQSQLSRIRTARERATQEDRRATPHPSDQQFLATGAGTYAHRRTPATTRPALGAPGATDASERGASEIAQPGRDLSMEAAEVTSPRGRGEDEARGAGVAAPSPGRGQVAGTGQGREGADVALGRPPVDRGPAATASARREIRVRDDRDAEQLAASLVQSFVDSTTHGGAHTGAGVGGVGGGGAPGSGGGEAEGGRAQAPGRGGAGSFREDPRYLRWYLDQRRRVHASLVFPQQRQLAMDQGTTVFRIVVRRDGSLRSPPSLVRSSGYADLDEAARRAILSAQPFAPLPPELAPGQKQLALRLPIEFQNPMVH